MWTDVYLVVCHSILAGVEPDENQALARLESVDRLDLVRWLYEARQEDPPMAEKIFFAVPRTRKVAEPHGGTEKTNRARVGEHGALEAAKLDLEGLGRDSRGARSHRKNPGNPRPEKRGTRFRVFLTRGPASPQTKTGERVSVQASGMIWMRSFQCSDFSIQRATSGG